MHQLMYSGLALIAWKVCCWVVLVGSCMYTYVTWLLLIGDLAITTVLVTCSLPEFETVAFPPIPKLHHPPTAELGLDCCQFCYTEAGNPETTFAEDLMLVLYSCRVISMEVLSLSFQNVTSYNFHLHCQHIGLFSPLSFQTVSATTMTIQNNRCTCMHTYIDAFCYMLVYTFSSISGATSTCS